MAKRKSAEQVWERLKAMAADRAMGLTVGQVCRKQGVTEQSDYRWRQLQEAEPTDASRQVTRRPRTRHASRQFERCERCRNTPAKCDFSPNS